VLLSSKTRYGRKSYEYEGYLRHWAFRRQVLQQYGYACSISGFQIVGDAAIVEAAHIQPHAVAGDNHITNGLALCPNLHRAFDRGWIGIDSEFQVIVHTELAEAQSRYQIRPFAGQSIRLPEDQRFWPDPEKLAWHRDQVMR